MSSDQVEPIEVEGEAEVVHVKAVAPDSRFHSANQANHCWNLYNEWVLCMKQKDGDEDACKVQRMVADSMCPAEWTEKWDEDREEGTFTGLK